ncbi:DNA-binding transcriptional LysR family regulator [Sphingobium boeckii]|uniref:DNA-binding transcriptional LysR family regulator n=2 Tax=Sphingobium boeckii TaxID=1082345 RepID=A0A7W9AHR0_9SPHN|nr:DNA-binding transcriptional LysR family regulator [Sphingobium boeckii]
MYFDEVARRGSIRRASDHLNIAASAVDRQILQLEQYIGAPLFERTTKGLILTAAGEILVETVRRTKRELSKAKSHIDDLQGLRRGEVSIVTVEGALAFIGKALAAFHRNYPAISHRVQVAPAATVADLVLANQFDVGLTFNPPNTHALRLEKTVLYKLGVAVIPGHPLTQVDVTIDECSKYPLIIPDGSLSLRAGIDAFWQRGIGTVPLAAFETSSFTLAKQLAYLGCGAALVTAIDVFDEVESGGLIFLPFVEEKAPLSNLSLIAASGRSLSIPSSLFIKHLSEVMMNQNEPSV